MTASALLLLANWWDDHTPRERMVLAGLALMASLLVGAAAIWIADRWRRRAGLNKLGAEQQMSTFRELYEQGVLSREEYDRIRGRLSVRMLPAEPKLPVQEDAKESSPAEPPPSPPPSAEPPGAGTSPT